MLGDRTEEVKFFMETCEMKLFKRTGLFIAVFLENSTVASHCVYDNFVSNQVFKKNALRSRYIYPSVTHEFEILKSMRFYASEQAELNVQHLLEYIVRHRQLENSFSKI